jgi:antitoxin component of MazEF toxin-antitoxin module
MVIVRFERTIRKSGGSAAIAIPPEVLNALGWKIGDVVDVYAEEQKITIKRHDQVVNQR